MTVNITFDQALIVLRREHDEALDYVRSLERRLATLVNGGVELTTCEVDAEHACPKCHQRTLVKVPLLETGQPREGVPGHVENPTGYTGSHRYVCQYDQRQGITIGPCGWVGWEHELK
jgi:hypothetical protein